MPGPGDTPWGPGETHNAAAGRRTTAMVRLQDRVAQFGITAGGLAVVLAMLGICLFLVVSAAPLFAGGRVTGERARFDLGSSDQAWMSLDPQFGRFITLSREGVFEVRSLETGAVLASAPTAEGDIAPNAVRSEAGTGWHTLTGEDGTYLIVRLGLDWTPEAPGAADAPLSTGQYRETMADGTVRVWTLDVTRVGPFEAGAGVVAVDARTGSDRERHVVTHAGSMVRFGVLRARRGLGQRDVTYLFTPRGQDVAVGEGSRAYATGSGAWAFVIDGGGRLTAHHIDDAVASAPVEFADGVTASEMALGGETLLVGDGRGELTAWTGAGLAAGTGPALRRRLGDSAIVSIRPGDRDRTIVVGFEAGGAVIYNTLSDKVIASVWPENPYAVAGAAASPATDAAIVVEHTGLAAVMGIEPGHTGASFKSLFGKVQYEGYDAPEHVYQSTGSAGGEPKFGLVPLIFGTMKATLVAMLFAAPLAVLAAIYSSEFLDRRVRRVFKPTIELMASLPSVVLGFMAAMVVAPFVRDHLPAVLTLGVTVPVAVVVAAHAWRMIPRDRRAGLGTGAQFGLIVLAAGLGLLVATPVGRLAEGVLFAPEPGAPGSILGWLNGDFGNAMPGWIVVLLLPSAGLVLVADAVVGSPAWRRLSDSRGHAGRHMVELIRLVSNLVASAGLAVALAALFDAAGLDPRDSVLGPFSQRNTLVVGVIMGIAVIPIIYTISEDAIRSVPDSLRSASLGVGATPWQTAMRVVLPVAGSGVFSACMIGLGRAVGETMIVLMATGNTPEMSWNIFSGFRTLAANIAVELPEAPLGSTHYRVLFLCGLVLFSITLVINTSAELVRQHFRRRNAAL